MASMKNWGGGPASVTHGLGAVWMASPCLPEECPSYSFQPDTAVCH
jgi:hypothetical protein